MKKSALPWLCLFFVLSANVARATVYYWDPEGTAAETATSLAGTWNATAEWSTSSSLTSSRVAFVSGYAACFCAGGTSVTTPFSVAVDSPISIGGIFNGSLNPPGCFVTVNGTGSLVLVAGADAFDTGGANGGTTTVAVPMTGPGQVALEGTAQVYFNATNTYSGGTSLGYPGVAAFSSTVNFNNGAAFGTGPIQMTSSGGNTMMVEGTSAINVTNAFVAANIALNIVGNPAGLTLSGPWNLAATPFVGSGGAGNLVTISGVMSGAGGFVKYNPSLLVLSGANTYTGGTTVSNGVLSITADNNLGAAPTTANYNLTLSGGTLNASNTFTLNSNRFTLLTAASAISVSTGNTLTYGGAITGTAGLSKTGPGVLALSGANGYTGATTIASGTLEADSQGGSAVGTNTVLVQPGAVLERGMGVVDGPVSGAGSVAPGTPTGPATLTLGNGLNLSGGGTLVWNLAADSTVNSFSTVSLTGGNLNLGGVSALSINFSGAADAPTVNNPFWQTQEAWTVVSANGSAGDSSLSKFTTILNGNYPAGNFTNYLYGNGDIVLLYQPNFTVFDALSDSGPGFFSGENLILTNFSGLSLSTWSSTNPSLPVSSWTLVGPMAEQPLAPQLPGYSRYSINVNPTVSPTYYVAGNTTAGPFIVSPVPVTIVTTPDFFNLTVNNTNVAISPAGVLALVPGPPLILPGAAFTNGGFQFQFTAETNQNYTIQTSADLISWTNIGFGTISNSPVTFIDPTATNANVQFYRVTVP